MGRKAKDGLSLHPKHGYRISIGKKPDGKYRVFWLGKTPFIARYHADTLKGQFANMQGEGRDIWTPADESAVDWYVTKMKAMIAAVPAQMTRERKEIDRQREELQRKREQHVAEQQLLESDFGLKPEPAPPGHSSTETTKPATLYAALDAYVASVNEGPGAASYKSGIVDSIDALKHYRPDCVLGIVDYGYLESLTNFIKARPPSRKKSKETKKHEPIRPHTVKRLLQHARQAFKWMHKHRHGGNRFGGWRMPEDALDLFGVDVDRIMTKAERDKAADGPIQITEEEIVNLYRTGIGENERHRLWFLTALFCAQGQTELSVTRREEFDLDAATFQHRRNKTGQRGKYWLPPELVTMLRQHFDAADFKPDAIVFATREGSPLVADGSDAVRQAYEDWRDRCASAGKPVRGGITFYSLRRYFADRATRIGGDTLMNAALAHSAKTVGGKHYSNYRDFEAVEQVGRAIYDDLVAREMFTPTPKEKQKEENRKKAKSRYNQKLWTVTRQ